MPVTMDDFLEAYNQIQAQGLIPDTIIMHPDLYKDLQQYEYKVTKGICDGISMRCNVGTPRLIVPLEPPVYKNRWQSIMEDEL